MRDVTRSDEQPAAGSTPVFRAVIFDMDGTLIRTTIDFRRMNQGIAETLLQHGLPRDILDPSGKVNESIVRAYSYFKMHSHDGGAEALERDLNRASLEVEMACGFGVCQGCVVRLANGAYAKVCEDGPVFDAAALAPLRPLTG